MSNWWGVTIGGARVLDDTDAPTHDGWKAAAWGVLRIDPTTGEPRKEQVVGWGESPNDARADLVRKVALINGQVTREIDVYDITPTCDCCGVSIHEADGWCKDCGNCADHCAGWEGCEMQ